jgi:eukaryotic-like serine/threonine-protein kinase
MSQSTPKTIGRYRIEGVLGQGAMSVVYAGFDPDIQRNVAIKCLHGEVATDPAYRRRFQLEARAAGNLTHPHIVTIFDTGETDDGHSYIAMERLPGDTLASRVAAEGFPSVSIIIELMSQLAAALDYAHAQGVIHHDVKPDNIVLIDGWNYAKITDFGIAEHRTQRSKTATTSSEISGTPAYMAPERLRGERGDARSDLFSLGVVMFWLLTHRLPWSYSEDVERLIRLRARLPEPPIKAHDPSAPPVLIDIVRTLMATSPQSRYQRGSEVVDDLQLARRSYERAREVLPNSRLHSLGVRWAAILGATVVIVLLAGMFAIYSKQNIAVTGLASDFGGSLARMIASDAAENIVIGDKAATRALVEDVARNQQIDYLAIADRDGGIIASTQANEIGQPLAAVTGTPQQSLPHDVATYRTHIASNGHQQDVLLFDVPIRYQTKRVGSLRLGISDAPLRAAENTALWVIGSVLAATLAAVLFAAYWLFRRLRIPMEMLAAGLLRVAHGDFEHRIRLVRRDEFGRLFAAFNVMSESLGRGPRNTVAEPKAVVSTPIIQPTQIVKTRSETSDST